MAAAGKIVALGRGFRREEESESKFVRVYGFFLISMLIR